jgi:hypothetical protein
MHYDYLEDWKDAFNQLQKPFQEIVELNVKTLKKLAYIKPDELPQLKKPEDFLEKNVNVLIANGHNTLDYLEQAFHICEKHLLAMATDITEGKNRN